MEGGQPLLSMHIYIYIIVKQSIFIYTRPPIIMEVENGALEDEFNLQGVDFKKSIHTPLHTTHTS